jgi:hypothetical protein
LPFTWWRQNYRFVGRDIEHCGLKPIQWRWNQSGRVWRNGELDHSTRPFMRDALNCLGVDGMVQISGKVIAGFPFRYLPRSISGIRLLVIWTAKTMLAANGVL